MNLLQTVYPTCCRLLEHIPHLDDDLFKQLPEFLAARPALLESYPYLADLARIEAARYSLAEEPAPLPQEPEAWSINPNLRLIPVQWRGLPDMLEKQDIIPRCQDGFVLVWRSPNQKYIRTAEADGHDLLALKIIAEGIDSRTAAAQGNVTVGAIDDILQAAGKKGILLSPASLLTRPAEFFRGEVVDAQYCSAQTFTLQWHLTQNCDLHCRHCYDRSARPDPTLAECIRVLDQLYDFCRGHHVFGQVSFSGGNPLLYPHFHELYRETVDRGFLTAILGNPMPEKNISAILAIQKPEFYQVSLEGLREHNDYIRGPGHYDRVFAFLALLRETRIYSMVMLTLTRANMEQVLELADLLRDRVDLFTFNRLAMVGQGAALASVEPDEYRSFLAAYLNAAAHNACMGQKDNLLNILRHEANRPLFGGCTGHGCGAAFNFMALLPDGEVHACRKFPSRIGTIREASLADIYHGAAAAEYRAGSEACSCCAIRPVCGGCPAVVHGFGLDALTAKDPYCFL